MHIPWIPREPKFFDMLDEMVELIVKGAEVLVDLVEHWEHPERRFHELGELEHRCDRCVEKLLTTLGCTLITPLDRDDLHALAKRLDDVLDNIEEAAFRLTAFSSDPPSPHAVTLAQSIQRSCRHLQQALRLCRANLGSEALAQELRELACFCDEAQQVYRQAEVALFANPPAMATFLQQRELSVRLKSTVNACGEVANALREIVVKLS